MSRQDRVDISQPEELTAASDFKRQRELQARLAQQGVDAAPLLTIAWAILVSNGIPDTQATNDVIYSHEEILSKFINYTRDDTERAT